MPVGKRTVQPEDDAVVLLVEDDKDVRDYLHKSLENDYEIIEAANGIKGYDKACLLYTSRFV